MNYKFIFVKLLILNSAFFKESIASRCTIYGSSGTSVRDRVAEIDTQDREQSLSKRNLTSYKINKESIASTCTIYGNSGTSVRNRVAEINTQDREQFLSKRNPASYKINLNTQNSAINVENYNTPDNAKGKLNSNNSSNSLLLQSQTNNDTDSLHHTRKVKAWASQEKDLTVYVGMTTEEGKQRNLYNNGLFIDLLESTNNDLHGLRRDFDESPVLIAMPFKNTANHVKWDDCVAEFTVKKTLTGIQSNFFQMISMSYYFLKPRGTLTIPLRFILECDLENPKKLKTFLDYKTTKQVVLKYLESPKYKDTFVFGIPGSPRCIVDPFMENKFQDEIQLFRENIIAAKQIFESSSQGYKNIKLINFLHDHNIFMVSFQQLMIPESEDYFLKATTHSVLSRKLSLEIFKEQIESSLIQRVKESFADVTISYEQDFNKTLGFSSSYRKRADIIITATKAK